MPPSDADEPVATAVGRGGHADDGLVQVRAAHRAVERRVAEGEDAAVGGDEPVAGAVGGGAMPTIGLLRWWPPVEPKKPASPKVKMPPSEATSQ